MADPQKLAVPGSKSATQRALIVAALAGGESVITGPLDCDDSRVLRAGLRAMGVTIDEDGDRWRVIGGRLETPGSSLWCGEAGTVLRFLTPLSLLVDELSLDGSPRLRERPIARQLEALAALGVAARYPERRGGLPVVLTRRGRAGSVATVEASQSSQFASGLLLVGPCLPDGLVLTLGGASISRPYLDLTLEVMAAFGAEVTEGGGGFTVPASGYRPGAFAVEGDWSSAAFLLVAARIRGMPLELTNVRRDTSQGDVAIIEFLARLDGAGPHRFDLTRCPDLIAPLAAACALANAPCEITGVAHARLKESDRVAVLAGGLRRAGVRVTELPGGLRFEPGARLLPCELDPHNDHRMAMAFSLLSLREPGIRVSNPGCVNKSYPTFWTDLDRLRKVAADGLC